MVCNKCQIDYPDSVGLSPVIGGDSTGLLCGICALEHINKIHGVKRTEFQGSMAEIYRLDAIEFRKKLKK